jgi:uncharacterized protein involved in exopolysaccharide biosynthesis/Mrp family chromosome partitioning ATPase
LRITAHFPCWSVPMDSLVEARPGLAPAAPLLDPGHLLGVLRRSLIPIGVCVLAGAAGAYMLASTLPKSYTATGAVAVAGDRMGIPELEGVLRADNQPDPMPEVHTEMQALTSRQLVQKVIDQLHLDRDPEFNAALRKPGFFGRIKDDITSLLPHRGGAAPTGGADDALLGAVNHALVISQDNRSLVIGIAFTAHDPALAAQFVNTLIADYIQARADRRMDANQGANTVMSQRIEQVRKEIEQIEQKMRALRTSSGMVGLRAGSVGQQEVEDLATAASRATLDRSQIEATWEKASSLAHGGSSEQLASVLGSETISRLREQEAAASARVADLSMRYGPNWPALRSAQADLAATRRQIADEAQRIVASLATQLRVARAHEADVLAQLAAARHEGVAAQNVQAQLDQLQQDAATRRDLYRTLLERAQQTATQPMGDATPDVRVLSHAVTPGLPSAPNMKAATGLGGLGGGLLACAFALAFTSRKRALDPAAMTRIEGLTLIATLRGKPGGRGGLAARIAAAPLGDEADAMRVARARLGQMSRRAPRRIAFAGGQSGAAAAAAASAFARAAALDGQRVLLIEGDSGHHDLASVLGAAPGRLDDVLAGATDWRDAVAPDVTPGLDLLLGGPPAAAAPRTGVPLENLLVEAGEEYDLIVLGAPAAAQPDALGLARSSDVTVLVVESRGGAEPAVAAQTRLAPMSRSPIAAIMFMPA